MAKVDEGDMRAKITAIMMDASLSDKEKAQKRQALLCGKWLQPSTSSDSADKENAPNKDAAEAKPAKEQPKSLLEDTLKCAMCLNLCERPVTAPCQHNSCLACLKKHLAHGNKTCPSCRAPFPAKFMANPRINTALTGAIRMAKQGMVVAAPKAFVRINDADRPDEAFTTDRAVRSGRANAASGRIMVTIPGDHFGPIGPEHTPQPREGEPGGVFVGMGWKDRLDCRQWGAHFPHVAGIAGQSSVGAQSVVLSGGYEDDRDEGEWFLYTGSGGRDLSGNKRTSKTQSTDQVFELMNKALKLSCTKGMPVRVVRSAKEKRSSYAPDKEVEAPVRYDGVYRILRCWRKKGAQGMLMCRYLFVRCDNDPAPWTTGEEGDKPRMELPAEALAEIKAADKQQVFKMGDDPYWDYNEETGKWGWAKPQPPSQKGSGGGGDTAKSLRKKVSAHEKLLRDFKCGICKEVLKAPLSMPCNHNFCKACIDKRFEGTSDVAVNAARSLRVRKVPKPCPTCKADISDSLKSAAVNTEMTNVIEKLIEAAEKARIAAEKAENGEVDEEVLAQLEEGEQEEEGQQEEEEQEEEEESDDEEEGEQEGALAAGAAAADAAAVAEGQQQAGGSAAAEGAAAAAAGAAGAAANGPAAGAPSGTAAGAGAVGSGSASRWAHELAQLVVSFPQWDASLIECMLEDQGGDLEEVHAQLKRMSNQQAHARRAPPTSKPSAKKKQGKGAKGRASTAANGAAAADDDDDAEGDAGAGTSAAAEAAEGAQQQEEQEGAVPDAMDVDGNEPGAAKEEAAQEEEEGAAEAVQPKAKRGRGGKSAAAKAPAAKRGKRAAAGKKEEDAKEEEQQEQEEEQEEEQQGDEAGEGSDEDFQQPKGGRKGAAKKATAAPAAKKARRSAKS